MYQSTSSPFRVVLGQDSIVVHPAHSPCFFQLIVFYRLLVGVIQRVIVFDHGLRADPLLKIQGIPIRVGEQRVFGFPALCILRIPRLAVDLLANCLQLSRIVVRIFIFGGLVVCGLRCARDWPLDAESTSGRFPNVHVHLRHPEGNEVDGVGEQRGGSMDEFAVLRHGLHQMAACQVPDPLGWLLARLCLQLDLEHRVGKPLDILGGQLGEGIVNPDIHPAPIVPSSSAADIVLTDHGQFRVEGDADSRVTRELEGRSVVETASDRLQPPGDDPILNLSSQLLQVRDLLLALLSFPPHLIEHILHGLAASEERVDMLLFEGEPCLDRLLAGPVLAVGFPLDENLVTLHPTIPTKPNGLGALGLLQTSLVELPRVGIVVVDRRDGGVLLLEFLVGVEDEDRKVLRQLDGEHDAATYIP